MIPNHRKIFHIYEVTMHAGSKKLLTTDKVFTPVQSVHEGLVSVSTSVIKWNKTYKHLVDSQSDVSALLLKFPPFFFW